MRSRAANGFDPLDEPVHAAAGAARSSRGVSPRVPSASALRVAFLLEHFPKVSETFILDQITGLLDRGHDVRIHARGPEAGGVVHPAVTRYHLLDRCRYERPRARGRFARLATVQSLARIGLTRPAAAVRLVRARRLGGEPARAQLVRTAETFAERTRFQCVHAHFGTMGRVAQELRAAGLLRAPLVTSFHGYDVNVLPAKFPADYYAELFRHGDLFTVNSEFLGSRLAALGCPAERIVRLPMGVDLTRFPFRVRVPPAAGPVRLLSVGRLVEVKGFDDALRAIDVARRTGVHVRYTIVGDGKERNDLERLARDLGIADVVDFAGWRTQDDVSALYAEHHVFVHPGVTARDGAQEAQGVALLEALATGMPVVATRTGGVPDSVPDPEGWLVAERDVDALAAKLIQVCGETDAWEALGRAGRRHVERHFERGMLLDRLVELYRAVVSPAA